LSLVYAVVLLASWLIFKESITLDNCVRSIFNSKMKEENELGGFAIKVAVISFGIIFQKEGVYLWRVKL